MIYFYNELIKNNLLFKVLITVGAHDEINCECPEEIKEFVGNLLVNSMIKGGKPFCTRCELGADININKYWVH